MRGGGGVGGEVRVNERIGDIYVHEWLDMIGVDRPPHSLPPLPPSLPASLAQDMENKMRQTLNEIYFGKTKDVVNDLR